LEALRTRHPFLLFEYPVFVADLKGTGFRTVSLGSQVQSTGPDGLVEVRSELIEAAIDQAARLLTDEEMRKESVVHNLQIGRRHFSVETLRTHLAAYFENQS
jgi:FAD synthase